MNSSVTPSSFSETIREVQKIEEPRANFCKSEMFSSTTESQQTETKSEQKFHMKLEQKTPPVVEPKPLTEHNTIVTDIIREEVDRKVTEPKSKIVEEKATIENENIETSSIAKKDALSFFEAITKETETIPKGPKGMIKLVDDANGHAVKVGKLTKNYERSTNFQEVKKPEPPQLTDFQTTKKSVQEIFTKLECGPSSRGVDNKLFEFPYESCKLPPLDTKNTVLEDTITSTSSMHVTSSITELQTQTESAQTIIEGFYLVPEPPPEIGYMLKPEEANNKRPDMSIKATQIQEFLNKTFAPTAAPIGGVKTFPSPSPKVQEPPKPVPAPTLSIPPPPFELKKKEIREDICVKKDVYEKQDRKYFNGKKIESPKITSISTLRPISPSRPWSSSSDMETRSHGSTDISEYRCHSAASSHQETLRSSSPRPSADGLAMEKCWAKKCADSTRKSWPPQEEPTIKFKHEWQILGDDYKSSMKEFRRAVEEIPEERIKQKSVEKRSWSSKQEATEKITKRPPSPPKDQPIIYNAETIKVDHTVNQIREKSLFEKYTNECDVRKTETSEKIKEYCSKSGWTGDELMAPSLVRNVETPKKPVIQLYHFAEPAPVTEPFFLEPGSPPEIGYIPGPFIEEVKVEKFEQKMHVSYEQQPRKVSPAVVRTIPPASIPKTGEPPILPPEDVQSTPPPLPARQPATLLSPAPFPFKPLASPVTEPMKVTPCPTPTQIQKGSFCPESDYKSDFYLKQKWRPYESDNEESRYRKVQPSVPKQPVRSMSTEPEPLPPSRFELPATSLTNPLRPTISTEQQEKTCKKTNTLMKRQERESEQQQRYQVTQPDPIELKPGSPPIYGQPAMKSPKPKSPPVKKPDSPKFKVKTFQQESGYMADTDEPLQQEAFSSTMQKNFGKHEYSSSSATSHMESRTLYSERRSEYFGIKSCDSHQQQKKESYASAPIPTVQYTQKPSVKKQRIWFLGKSYASPIGTISSKFKPTKETIYSADQWQKKLEVTKTIVPPSSRPSKFVKSKFRENDYESDYDSRIPPLWKPRGYESDDQSFKPVKPCLASSGRLHVAENLGRFKDGGFNMADQKW